MDLLERAIRNEKFGTASAVAEFLGKSEAYISQIRHGKRKLQAIQAAKLAEAIGENWLEQVLPILSGLEPSEQDKAYWLGKAARLARIGGVSLALLLAVNVTDVRSTAREYSRSQVVDITRVLSLSDTWKLLIVKWFSQFVIFLAGFRRTADKKSSYPGRGGRFAQMARTAPAITCA